jgi:hypothetical protein
MNSNSEKQEEGTRHFDFGSAICGMVCFFGCGSGMAATLQSSGSVMWQRLAGTALFLLIGAGCTYAAVTSVRNQRR